MMPLHQHTTLLLLLLPLIIIIGTTNAFLIASPIKTNNNPYHADHDVTKLHESPVKFAGTGPNRLVDMNKYNIPLDQIQSEWTANIVPKTPDTEGGIFLGVENGRELFVDIIKVTLPRGDGSTSLGIGLLEIAGGREDGLGITIVTELVQGGLADRYNADINAGDSISEVSVIQKAQRTSISSKEEIISSRTECLGYDATVDSIVSLPPVTGGDDTSSYVLTIKRIRRKPRINVTLKFPPSEKQPDQTLQLFAGENLRLGMLVRGVKLNDTMAKRFDTKSGGNCGAGGLCRTCAVSVLRGQDLLSPQKMAEEQMLQDEPRWRLACKSFVGYGMKEGDLSIQVSPRQWYD